MSTGTFVAEYLWNRNARCRRSPVLSEPTRLQSIVPLVKRSALTRRIYFGGTMRSTASPTAPAFRCAAIAIGIAFLISASQAPSILRNEGTATWTAGINLNPTANGGSGRIENAAGGLLAAQGNNVILATGFADLNTLAGFPRREQRRHLPQECCRRTHTDS